MKCLPVKVIWKAGLLLAFSAPCCQNDDLAARAEASEAAAREVERANFNLSLGLSEAQRKEVEWRITEQVLLNMLSQKCSPIEGGFYILSIPDDARFEADLIRKCFRRSLRSYPIDEAEFDMDGVHHRKEKGVGVSITLGKISWVRSTVVTQEASCFRNGWNAYGLLYELEKRDGIWVIYSVRRTWIT